MIPGEHAEDVAVGEEGAGGGAAGLEVEIPQEQHERGLTAGQLL